LILAGAGRVVVPEGNLVLGSTAVTSTAAELNLLDGVSGLVQADLTKLAAIDATAAEINLIDGGTARGTTAVADADGLLHNDGGTMRMTSAATFKTYFQEGISQAYDDFTVGDAAFSVSTTAGNITIDAQGNDTDIIFKGTDGGADTTFLTIDGSAAGAATFNDKIIATELDISGDADIDGTLEADAITINGTAIASVLSPVAGHASIVTVGALNAGSITSGFTSIDVGAGAITTTGVITGGTVEATTDTAAGDNAAMGYTGAEGLILTGQGSTNDVTIKNDADADVIEIPTGTTNVTVAGNLGVGGTAVANTDTDTSNTGNVTLDFGANQNFVLTLTGNTTLVNPSTEQVGQSGFIAFIQDGTGSRTVSLGTDYETAASAGLTLTSTASATDLVPYLVVASGRILLGTPQLAFG